MSSVLFPGTLAAMPGLAWSVTKVPSFNSKIQTSVGNAELRASFTPYPRWTWTLKYNFLQGGSAGTAFETLLGFWLARRGAYDSFWYSDPTDSSVTAQQFGTGDGTRTQWQLLRTLGGFSEPVYAIPTYAIYNNGVLQTEPADYSNASGLITFTTPPAAGRVLTWTGTYYWVVRFTDDTSTFEEFADKFWQNQSVSFISLLFP